MAKYKVLFNDELEEEVFDTEEEAKALIQKIKDDDEGKGYEVTAYSTTKKTTKEDEIYKVKVVMQW